MKSVLVVAAGVAAPRIVRPPRRFTQALALAAALGLASWAQPMLAQDPEQDLALEAVLERLERLEAEQAAQRAELAERDRQIESLKAELDALRGTQPPIVRAVPAVPSAPADREVPALAEETAPTAPQAAAEPGEPADPPGAAAAVTASPTVTRPSAGASSPDDPLAEPLEFFGKFQAGGRGFKVADTPYGDLNISLYTYARYLNQNGLDDRYTDSFGREFDLDIRNDFQLQKAVVYFKGWVGDPRLRYLAYVWSANTSQGQSAQVVVAGNISWLFSDAFLFGAGISGLPTTRSTEGNFPRWLRVDNRTIADEYFRGSYTTGIFAKGTINERWYYSVMLGNNLSQLGVDAGQLDDTIDTFSGQVIWTPWGAYNNGFGDFEMTPELRTRLSLHYTHSTEDRQSQPGLDDPENSQIRISDGTRIFQPGAFNTDGRINEARYQMVALDWGFKQQGYALEGEFYYRHVDNFETEGDIPVTELEDWGYQLQASAMLVPNRWQAYLSGSQIFGEYGDPWDVAVGVNWFPLKSSQFRLNAETIFIRNSPVGFYSVPYIVGADGTIFYVTGELTF